MASRRRKDEQSNAGWLYADVLLGLLVVFLAASAINKANITLQWVIILLVFIPICIGFFIFGKYASTNEYAHLPESSTEIE